jgi:DNA-binding LytR/AlgR family response regulator
MVDNSYNYFKNKGGDEKLKIAICDDDNTELKMIKRTVDEFISIKQKEHLISADTFKNGDELLSYINKHERYDLLILDIIMPGMNGLELAAEIRRNDSTCKILFLTSSPEFAVNSYHVNAYYYLLKPFFGNELKNLLNRALNEIGEEKSTSIVIKEKGKLTRVPIHTIQYVECVKHTIFFHLHDNVVISCYGTLNEFSEILLSDKLFIKCHKSFIANMKHIVSISAKDFIMSDKTLVPISRQVYQQIKNTYIDYFFERGN